MPSSFVSLLSLHWFHLSVTFAAVLIVDFILGWFFVTLKIFTNCSSVYFVLRYSAVFNYVFFICCFVFLEQTNPLTFFFWRVNVLYFVGIGSQPEKTWHHRELTAPEVVARNHGNGGINNNMAAQQTPPTSRLAMNARRGKATMVTAE